MWNDQPMACFSKSDDYIYQFSSLRTAMDNESAVRHGQAV